MKINIHKPRINDNSDFGNNFQGKQYVDFTDKIKMCFDGGNGHDNNTIFIPF